MQNIDKLLKEYDLFHKKENIINSSKTSIGVRKLSVDDLDIPIGSSKLGGLPDLPPTFTYPKYHNGYLTFLAQFNLEEIKPFDEDNLLPEKGILYFFYDVEEQPWGFEKEDKECFKVLYFEGDHSILSRTPYPEETEDYYPLNSFQVEFNHLLSFSEEPVGLDLDEDESENYLEFRDESMHVEDDDGDEEETIPIHYLLGHPFNIQNDVFEEIVYYGHEEKYEWDSEKVGSESKKMVLLFQMDTDDDLEVMWGDSGIIYFCIDHDDLKNKRFERTKFILQCY
jgi:uncharacterized protein YwqG